MTSRGDLAKNPRGGRLRMPAFKNMPPKRTLMMALMGVAFAAFLLALGVTVFKVANATTWLIVSLATLVLTVAAELVLLVWGENRKFDDSGEWYDWEKEAKKAGGKDLLLRCTGCNKTFPVKDTGERPLRTSCTHCGKTGTLRDVHAR